MLYNKIWELHGPTRWYKFHNEFQIVMLIDLIDQIYDVLQNI